MGLASINEAIEDIKAGKVVIIVDDKDERLLIFKEWTHGNDIYFDIITMLIYLLFK